MKKENIKALLFVLIFSFTFFGCDTVSSGTSSSTIIGTSDETLNGSQSTSAPEPVYIDTTVVDSATVISGSSIVTSARGDAPPGPPVIISE